MTPGDWRANRQNPILSPRRPTRAAPSRLLEAARRVVPEQLPRQLALDARPVEDLVDRVREPALEMRVVGAEHQAPVAERLRHHVEHRLLPVRLRGGEEAPGRAV